MKQITFFIIALIFASACKTYNSVHLDSSQSVATVVKPIAIIKKYILKETVKKIEIEIVNYHGGEYRLSSIIQNLNQTIHVNTHTTYMTGLKADTILMFSKNNFMEKLDFESDVADKQINIAGNFQTIKIKVGKLQHKFNTRKALGLMFFLEKGKSSIIY